jgi:hypothetical protein
MSWFLVVAVAATALAVVAVLVVIVPALLVSRLVGVLRLKLLLVWRRVLIR